jgi:hypothetical protein
MSGAQDPHTSATGAGEQPGADQASDDELRAAYEEELSRITSAELMLQAAVSLLNVAGRRLGLAPADAGGEPPAPSERDLEDVREAIDGVRALFSVLERRFGQEIAPLRNALSQLQLAYAREAQAAATAPGAQGAPEQSVPSKGAEPREGSQDEQDAEGRKPGPAEASGRLWVPGR